MLKEKLQALGITIGSLPNDSTHNSLGITHRSLTVDVGNNYIHVDPKIIQSGTTTTYVNYDPEKDRLKKELQEARDTIKQLQRDKFGGMVCYGKVTEMEISNDFDRLGDTPFMKKIAVNRWVEMSLIVEDIDPAFINHMQAYLKITFELDDR